MVVAQVLGRLRRRRPWRGRDRIGRQLVVQGPVALEPVSQRNRYSADWAALDVNRNRARASDSMVEGRRPLHRFRLHPFPL